MSMIHDQPHVVGSVPPPPGAPSTGPGGPGSPGSTEQAGEWSGPPRHHHRALVAVTACLAVAAAVAAAAVLAAGGPTHRTTQSALTTAQITARTDPALVDVVATLGYQRATSSGTGIVLTSSGEVLTNNHVIEGATSINVTDVGNGRSYRAVVVGYDQKTDIAVLQLQHASGLTTATLGTSAKVNVGDVVVGVGNAGGRGGTPSAVTGKVTALDQSITASDLSAGTVEHLTGLIRTDASIQAGDSGGPLVNSHGQVIGIDTAAPSSYQLDTGTLPVRSFAIPVGTAVSIADKIEAGRASGGVHIGATAFLGIQLLPGSGLPGRTGVTVAGVEPGQPAAAAGLQPGDEITSVAGHRVSAPTDVQSVLGAHHPGDKISIGWLDPYGQAHTATVVLATGPAG
jgi:S1-C subfamily serine protease